MTPRSHRTTIAGILLLIGSVLLLNASVKYGQPVSFNAVLPAALVAITGIGLIYARDRNE